MTSKVTITAHCEPTKQVAVYIRPSAEELPELVKVLQNGETADFFIYDEKSLITYEENIV